MTNTKEAQIHVRFPAGSRVRNVLTSLEAQVTGYYGQHLIVMYDSGVEASGAPETFIRLHYRATVGDPYEQPTELGVFDTEELAERAIGAYAVKEARRSGGNAFRPVEYPEVTPVAWDSRRRVWTAV